MVIQYNGYLITSASPVGAARGYDGANEELKRNHK
jgi:hypothetical protein